MSEQQRMEAEKFKQKFPLIDSVYKFFCPAMWGYVSQHKVDCMTEPCISLNYIDALYNVEGAAKWIVKTNILGIYGMSSSKEPFSDQNAGIAADLFISRYGNQCSLYMLALYFANYIMDFKGSYAHFDIQDILLQFRAKFLPWWNASLDAKDNKKEEPKSKEVKGLAALEMWLMEKVMDGCDVRKGGLYLMGILTEEMVQKAEKKYAPQTF